MSRDPTTLQSVGDALHLPDTWMLYTGGSVYKGGKVMGMCGDLPPSPGDNYGVSWTLAGI